MVKHINPSLMTRHDEMSPSLPLIVIDGQPYTKGHGDRYLVPLDLFKQAKILYAEEVMNKPAELADAAD